MTDRRAIALGFFDGIHIGHAALLRQTRQRAEELGAVPTVLTFDTHPDTLVKRVEVPLINSANDRTDLIRRLFGIESVVFIHFNETVMRMPWREFIETLSAELNACHYVVGHDFSFGYKGEGTAERLRACCAERGMGCDIIPPVSLDGEIVSSTRIRALLQAGEMEAANRLLGHPHSLTDTVRYGYQLGMKLGAPTINMQFQEGVLVPRHGVYAARVFPDNGGEYAAVTNVGVRPTFNGSRVSVESHILDYNGNLYDHRVRVEFHAFLRPEQKFPDAGALRAQIFEDARAARAYFSEKA